MLDAQSSFDLFLLSSPFLPYNTFPPLRMETKLNVHTTFRSSVSQGCGGPPLTFPTAKEISQTTTTQPRKRASSPRHSPVHAVSSPSPNRRDNPISSLPLSPGFPQKRRCFPCSRRPQVSPGKTLHCGRMSHISVFRERLAIILPGAPLESSAAAHPCPPPRVHLPLNDLPPLSPLFHFESTSSCFESPLTYCLLRATFGLLCVGRPSLPLRVKFCFGTTRLELFFFFFSPFPLTLSLSQP